MERAPFLFFSQVVVSVQPEIRVTHRIKGLYSLRKRENSRIWVYLTQNTIKAILLVVWVQGNSQKKFF
jgi:hypothetical protein